MKIRPTAFIAFRRPRCTPPARLHARFLLTLAIETSCDDTSVAILEKYARSANGKTHASLHFHKKITSNNTSYQGVHPLVSLQSHQENLARLIDEAIQHLPFAEDGQRSVAYLSAGCHGEICTRRLPDFVSVTRGPGMRSNLSTGIDTAKGLAAAWQVGLVGVHHMQAHALTPRLVAALQGSPEHMAPTGEVQQASSPHQLNVEPSFPFLSVLASGGHTLLIQSTTLTDHKVLASTSDIAIGECLDKIARVVLPPEVLSTARSTMYGALLEKFAFEDPPAKLAADSDDPRKQDKYMLEDFTAREYLAVRSAGRNHEYATPDTEEGAQRQNRTRWGWTICKPLSKAAGGSKNKSLELSFAGFLTYVERLVQFGIDPSTGKLNKDERSAEAISIEERRDLARESMRAAFEHVASRVVLGLGKLSDDPCFNPIKTVVMAGGVAANSYFRHILASTLSFHGYSETRIVCPPPSLCTDNAAMIAWTGIEMFSAGHTDLRTIRAIRKWPLDQLLLPPEVS